MKGDSTTTVVFTTINANSTITKRWKDKKQILIIHESLANPADSWGSVRGFEQRVAWQPHHAAPSQLLQLRYATQLNSTEPCGMSRLWCQF
jgi:hypothetical protein